MSFTKNFYICAVLFLFTSNTAFSEEQKPFNWNSYQFRVDLGVASKLENTPAGKKHYIAGPMMEYGFERGFVLSDRIYLGGDVTWTVFYPDNFKTTSLEPYKLWLIPITHLHAGYIFSDDSLLTVGSTYFWGLIVTYRKPISRHSYIEVKGVKWLDEKWDGDLPFHQAIHEYYLTAGYGYAF